jgi:hypothetical protein
MGSTISYADVNGEFVDTVAWPRGNMDLHDPLSLPEAGLNVPGDFGFQQGDGCNWAIWQILGNGGVLGSVGAEKVKAMPQEQKIAFSRYQLFWQNVTAGYYGTPAVRRLTCAMSLASFEAAMANNTNWFGRRPLGSALLIELTVHKQYYQGLEVQPIVGLDKISDARSAESMVAKPVMLEFVHNKLTLEQDRRLRDLIKAVALANPKWTESKLVLPENQAYELDPAKDPPLATERMKILTKQ